jgi:hypothetical protein
MIASESVKSLQSIFALCLLLVLRGLALADATPPAPVEPAPQLEPNQPIDRQIEAMARVAEYEWRHACKAPDATGACFTIVSVGSSCKKSVWRFVAQRREPERAARAQSLFAAVARLYDDGKVLDRIVAKDDAEREARRARVRAAYALALVRRGDAQLESLLGEPAPKVVLEPAATNSTRAMVEWLQKRQQGTQIAQTLYQQTLQAHDLRWIVVAAGRIGQLYQSFAAELKSSDPAGPKTNDYIRDAYCSQIEGYAEPIEAKAIEAFNVCLNKAQEFHVPDELSAPCTRGIEQLTTKGWE